MSEDLNRRSFIKKSVDFSVKAVHFMTVTVGSPMDVSLKMNGMQKNLDFRRYYQYNISQR